MIRAHLESSKFDLHAKNLFLKFKNIAGKKSINLGEENREKLKKEVKTDETSETKIRYSKVTLRNKLRERLSFSNLERWKSHPESTSTQGSLVEEAAMRKRINLPNTNPPVSIENLIQGKTSGPTRVSSSSRLTTDIQKIRRVVFSPFNYPSLPLEELGTIQPEDGESSRKLLT